MSPFELDRELARVLPRVARTCRGLHEGKLPLELDLPAVLLDPETLERLAQDRSDPIAAPLLRFLYRLELWRRLLPLERERINQYRVERHPLDRPLQGHFTLRELLGHSLRDEPRRPALLGALLERSGRLQDATSRAFEARAAFPEFAGKSRDALELPSANVVEQARAFLADSKDAYSSLGAESLHDLVELGLAHGAADGWPRRLDLRSLNDLMGEPGWLSGLRLNLGDFPAPIAPASFVRGLLRLGAAWTEALAPAGAPWVLAHDAFGLSACRHGALFGLLAISPAFLRRQLALGRERARRHETALARSALVFARCLALKLLLREPALQGTRAFRDAFSEHSSQAFGFELPPSAAGVLFRPAVGDAQRLAGLWLAATRSAELTSVHDEDWFRNPRAIEQLRAEAAVIPSTHCTPDQLVTGSRELVEQLSQHL